MRPSPVTSAASRSALERESRDLHSHSSKDSLLIPLEGFSVHHCVYCRRIRQFLSSHRYSFVESSFVTKPVHVFRLLFEWDFAPMPCKLKLMCFGITCEPVQKTGLRPTPVMFVERAAHVYSRHSRLDLTFTSLSLFIRHKRNSIRKAPKRTWLSALN